MSIQLSAKYHKIFLNKSLISLKPRIKIMNPKRNILFMVLICFLVSIRSISQVIDIDGNIYKTIIIGNQEWMAENLKVEHYRNGDLIPRVQDEEEWKALRTGSWCYYQNKPENGLIFGKLYSWYAVNDKRGLAPKGWHIPSNEEWDELVEYLGGKEIAGKKMIDPTLWGNNNIDASNESGFTAIPSGCGLTNGYTSQYSCDAFYWTSSQYDNENAWFRMLLIGWTDLFINSTKKKFELAIRCIKD